LLQVQTAQAVKTVGIAIRRKWSGFVVGTILGTIRNADG
jgi:hypothetical protein